MLCQEFSRKLLQMIVVVGACIPVVVGFAGIIAGPSMIDAIIAGMCRWPCAIMVFD